MLTTHARKKRQKWSTFNSTFNPPDSWHIHGAAHRPARTFALPDSQFEDFLEVSVADSGIGIPGMCLERLFQSYSRIDSGAEQQFEGTGLGLMLVKQLVELHGGTVAVESAESHGSRFVVWLPMRTDTTIADAQNQIVAQEGREKSKTCTQVLRELSQQRTFVSV